MRTQGSSALHDAIGWPVSRFYISNTVADTFTQTFTYDVVSLKTGDETQMPLIWWCITELPDHACRRCQSDHC